MQRFYVVRVSFISMSSSIVPVSNCNLISLEYHPVNFCLKNDFPNLLTVRSKGWNICVILAGTRNRRISFSFKRSKTGYVICSLKISIISKAGWHSLSNQRRSLLTYDKLISWINSMLSVVLLKCFIHIGTKRKWFWIFGSRDTLGSFSSLYQLYWEETVKKGNTKCCCKWFSVRHTRNAKMFTIFFCKVLTSYWCMFQWRLVKTIESGISFSSTKLIISWRKRISASFLRLLECLVSLL